jgi:hypothetical protein
MEEKEILTKEPTAIENNGSEQQSFKTERFFFTLYINDFIVCQRNFSINNFIENSMQTIEFKETVDKIVKMIDDDLKQKSRVYLWYNYNPDDPVSVEEFNQPLIEPWSYTFRFEVSDRDKVMISKIWDGYGYPRAIRDRVDLSNKTVKITTKDGKTYSYDKESFFKQNEGRLSFDHQVLRSMIIDKADLIPQITRIIRDTCSSFEDENKTIASFTTTYNVGDKKLPLNIWKYNNKLENEWTRIVSKAAKKKIDNKKKEK